MSGASRHDRLLHLTLSVSFVEKCIGGGCLTSNGPQHFEINDWQRKGCRNVCAESQSTSRGPKRTCFLVVQTAILTKMQCDKKSLLASADASNKRNLMTVGGHTDHVVDLCGEDSADGKGQCLGKGQTMVTKPPSQAEFQECWSEVIIKCGLSPSVVDDPLFRKSLVTTTRMG